MFWPRRDLGEVSLTSELERLIDDKVKSGLYQTASEVVREALRLLKQRDEQLSTLRADVHAGFAELERGKGREFDSRSTKKLADAVKARGRKRLARAE